VNIPTVGDVIAAFFSGRQAEPGEVTPGPGERMCARTGPPEAALDAAPEPEPEAEP
jgi:hypothetical protein